MNWKLRFLLLFVNNVQPIREVDIAIIEKERKNKILVSNLGKILFDKKKEVKEIRDFSIEGTKARLYRNSSASGQKVIVYFHGGGFVFYNIESHDYVARRLCSMNDCTVISVDYRLAPEHTFPAAHEDAYKAIEYVAAHAEELGIDAAKIIVAGDSAGGNLAACAVHHFKNNPGVKIVAQVASNSIEQYKEGYLLTKQAMLWFQKTYTPKEEDKLNPEVSPIYHTDFSGLPPAFVLTAEYDPLKDEGKAYADKLTEAGNVVLYKDYKELVHGFFNLPKLSEESIQAYYDIQAFLKKVV